MKVKWPCRSKTTKFPRNTDKPGYAPWEMRMNFFPFSRFLMIQPLISLSCILFSKSTMDKDTSLHICLPFCFKDYLPVKYSSHYTESVIALLEIEAIYLF